MREDSIDGTAFDYYPVYNIPYKPLPVPIGFLRDTGEAVYSNSSSSVKKPVGYTNMGFPFFAPENAGYQNQLIYQDRHTILLHRWSGHNETS